MNNLNKELAPISEAAWIQIEAEATRTLKRHLAARRVVDLDGPNGIGYSGAGTGHTKTLEAPGQGILAVQREVQPLVELRVPFELTRRAIDDVERGSNDSDWSPVKEAAKIIAFAEDNAVFEGYEAAGIGGIRKGNTNKPIPLPAQVKGYPDAVARALSQLRQAGVNGPYHLVLGAEQYTAAEGGSDEGYPVLQHIRRLIDGEIIWAPALSGGFLLSGRGGDYELSIGQDFSIGYLEHSAANVMLYLQESFTFRLLTTEAAVAMPPAGQ
ncbi:MAG TPA: family 1 encapsulin nanocompartment shell protein [Puia sp.]|nr:family 1 encapsulin nanocompartment shell protein [Puia sp.]